MKRAATTRDMVPGFGDRVRELRETKGWSQGELAARAGSHFTTVSQIELGKRSASLRLALVLADALGVSITRLVPADWRERLEASKAGPGDGTEKAGADDEQVKESGRRGRARKKGGA